MPSDTLEQSAYRSSMPVTGPVLRRTLWREWRGSLLMFFFASAYTEVCLHLWVYQGLNGRILYHLGFALVFACLCSLLASSLPKLPGRILSVLLVAAEVLWAEVQLVYHAIFGNFMPISQVQMGDGVVTNFGKQILFGIRKNLLPIGLLLIPVAAMLAGLLLRRAPRYRLRWRQSLATLGVMLAALCLTLGFMVTGKGEPFSVYEILTNVNTSTDVSYKNVGMLATTEQELRYMLLGVGAQDARLNDVSLGVTETPRHYSAREYNVIEDIDFEDLAVTARTDGLRTLDEYFSTVIPTRKNDYTGLLKDYNLITICAESFCPWFISEELTPTLWEMSHTGILFENFYGAFQSVTTNGEYTMCTGLYPDMSRSKTASSFDAAGGNYLPFCLGNALRAEGYQTWAYHNYIGDFYNRNVTHPNMGYTFQAADSGLDVTVDWPSSDLEMMEASVDDYLNADGPFHAYYMTFSGHYQYNWHNAMSAKNRDRVEALPYSEPVKAYIACNLELEYALEYLVARLEEAGVLDHTCIVLTNDHYPYGLTEEEYNELAGQELDTTFEKYRNSFLCYVPGLRENVVVDEYCSTADILPTLLNLFGVAFDSRLLAGTDVLSGGIHVAVLADETFLTKRFRFDADTETLEMAQADSSLPADALSSYRLYVDNKFKLSADILNNDYYAHVFGVAGQGQTVADTVVFTDIQNIFNQASVLYMYRNGYVDPETETTFGGRHVAKLGEFLDVLYRIAGRPAASNAALPEGYEGRRFNASLCPWYDAVCWAWETGLLQSGDYHDGWSDSCDYRTAALLIYRYAVMAEVDTSIDETVCDALAEENPRVEPEVLRAMIWCSQENITTRTGDLETLVENYDTRISRYQMTSYLFYLCTYKLGLADDV